MPDALPALRAYPQSQARTRKNGLKLRDLLANDWDFERAGDTSFYREQPKMCNFRLLHNRSFRELGAFGPPGWLPATWDLWLFSGFVKKKYITACTIGTVK